MATANAERELEQLEQRYWNAIRDNDVAAAAALTDFPCLVTGSHGVARVDKKTFEAMMSNTKRKINRADLSEVQVRLLREDVAVIAYKVREEITKEDGTSITLDAADSSTWIRRNGHWTCAMHSESIAGDHFNQDREAKSSSESSKAGQTGGKDAASSEGTHS